MKPGDLLLGVSDFFAVLLPGALVILVGIGVAYELHSDAIAPLFVALKDGKVWWAAGVIAYAIGHIVASWGSRLDDLFERDKVRHERGELKGCAERVLEHFARRAFAIVPDRGAQSNQLEPTPEPKSNPPKAVRKSFTGRVVRALTTDAWQQAKNDGKLINAYKLSRITLNLRAPNVYAEVIRLEADSKFFRSLVVVATLTLAACLIMLGGRLLSLGHPSLDTLTPVLFSFAYLSAAFLTLRLAYSRYCELRLKAIQLAFQGLVFLAVEEAASAT
jgi:hypothetical protein